MEIHMDEELGRVPVTVLRVDGRINMGSADELVKKVQEARQGGMTNLLMDLSGSPSITSAGLRAILSIYKLLGGAPSGTSTSVHFKLLSPSPDVLKVLRIAGFDRYLEIFDDRAAALASFG